MPQSMSPEEYQELGRRYYKLKQYDKALETFSKGINAAPSLSLYDHRAACYDRLKDFNAAIKDGRAMIKLDKEDVKGYLRTASILEKMDKPDTALGIYKYGMKNVPVSDKNFKLLQQLHDKITRKLSPAKAIDPLVVLPVELAEMVLEYLPFRNLVNCMRVSKGWRDYISKLYRLWMHLDLSDAKKPVLRSFVDKAVRRSNYRLVRFTIHRFQHLDVVLNIAKACKDLADIELLSLPIQASASLIELARRATNLKRYVLHTDISADTIQQILHHRPTLEHAEFRSLSDVCGWADSDEQVALPNLLTLRLNGQNCSRALRHRRLFELTPVLQTLIVTNLNFSSLVLQTLPLRTLILKGSMIEPPQLPSTLEHFTWEPRRTVSAEASWGETYYSCVSSLTHLSVTNIERLSADWFSRVIDHWIPTKEEDDDQVLEPDSRFQATKNATPLRYLSIKGTLRDDVTSLFAESKNTTFREPSSLFGRSPRILTPALKHLTIADLPCDDNEIEHLVSHGLRLESIDLSASNITGASIKMLADGIPTLKHIRADNASRINGRDAIGYAERKGIVVSCSMGEGKSGKKIRYL